MVYTETGIVPMGSGMVYSVHVIRNDTMFYTEQGMLSGISDPPTKDGRREPIIMYHASSHIHYPRYMAAGYLRNAHPIEFLLAELLYTLYQLCILLCR